MTADIKKIAEDVADYWFERYYGVKFTDVKDDRNVQAEREYAGMVAATLAILRRHIPDSEVSAEVNQCDGCARGLLLDVEENIHREPNGMAVMSCTAHRYAARRPTTETHEETK